jgi:alpha-ketoglutarate-dependent taurine dioxygenase
MKQAPKLIENTDISIKIQWPDNGHSIYHYIWLRDNCSCCRHSQTNHRLVETSNLPLDIKPQETIFSDKELKIYWKDGHISLFSFEWLKKYDYSNNNGYAKDPIFLWDRSNYNAIPTFDYSFLSEKNSSSKENLSKIIEGFYQYGIIFIKNIPVPHVDVLDIVDFFGYIRETNWGRTYHVKSYADANSVAYTNHALFGHTDDPYRDPIATAQISLFTKNTTKGGESTLCDGFKIAEDMRVLYPEHFELLAKTPIHFYLKDNNNIFESIKTIIELDSIGQINCIRYSNHSSQPFNLPPEKMYDFYAAYQQFGKMREHQKYQLKIKMNQGDLYMIDNTRILHGRSEYSATEGERNIHGCFLEKDQILSNWKINRLKTDSYWSYWLKMSRY